ITLDLPAPKRVSHEGRSGRLVVMNAESLEIESGSYDLVLSVSTFEHFGSGEKALKEMYRGLCPGGSALVTSQPGWTPSRGHHLHHRPRVSSLLPPWAHLLWTESSMRQHFDGVWPVDAEISLDEAVRWIFHGREINRVPGPVLRRLFEGSDF